MNILAYIIILIIGNIMWKFSGVRFNQKYFWVGLTIMLILWWGIWGQVAIFDGWWTYTEQSISLGHVGVVPVADFLYFFAGLGWYFYLCHKLDLF